MGDEVGVSSPEAGLVWSLSEQDFVEMDYGYLRQRCYRTAEGFALTPGWLLETAERAEARYRELQFRFPPGTVHTERNLMRELSEGAMEVAAWMEAKGLESAIYAGPFGPKLPTRGAKVLIRRGAEVFSTSPSVKRAELGRALRVTASSVDGGYIDVRAREGRNEERVRTAQVHWAGAGGYWRWTDANNIVRED